MLMCLNISNFQSTLHLMQYTYQDVFSTQVLSGKTCFQKQVLNSLILMPFSASALFVCSTFSTPANHFPLRTFSFGETKKSRSG